MRSYFPDINIWVALAYDGHRHHAIAMAWFDQLTSDRVGFCRLTQLSFLRLLTQPAVMQDEVSTQREAWKLYDELCDDWRVTFYPERDPDAVEAEFRALTASTQISAQQWPDAYLVAFAKGQGLMLVTFDRALSKLAGEAGVLLG